MKNEKEIRAIKNEKEIRAIKNEIWAKYYNELQCNCENCPHYHVQLHENFNSAMQTTHRCKALSTDHRDEYSRGYYQIMDIGTICPLTNKMITSKHIGEVMKIANSPIYIRVYAEIKAITDKDMLIKLNNMLKEVETLVLSK